MSPKVTALPVKTIRKRKLYEEIAEQLEGMMMTGTLAPGDQLPSERELMETFEVGRTAVREALFALERMGLIVQRSGERSYVTRPSVKVMVDGLSGSVRHFLARPEGIREMQQARAMLEISLARHAALHATAEDLAELKEALELNRGAVGKPEEFVRTDVSFHFVLAKITHNSIFTSLHEALAGWLSEQRITSLKAPDAFQAACDAHEAIYAAIEKHDADAAEKAMSDHLHTVEQKYWRVAEEKNGDSDG